MSSVDEVEKRRRVDEYMQRCSAVYLGSTTIYTFPMFIEGSKPGYFNQIGTGVAVEKEGKYYLVTAEHVVREALGPNGRDIFIGTGSIRESGSLHKIPLSSASSWRFHPNESFDLAVGLLPVRLGGLQFFPLSGRSHIEFTEGRSHDFLAGYPVSVNKERDVNSKGGTKTTGIAPIIVKVDHTLDFGKDRKNPVDFLGFKYGSVVHGGVRKQQGTHPRGMSGCGLWRFPNRGKADDMELAGIFIEWHKGSKNGYATSVKHIHDLLDD